MIILHIGNSIHNSKSIKCSNLIKSNVYKINKYNWASFDNNNITFDINIDGNVCLVTRTDKERGWDMDLKIYVETYNISNITITMTTLPIRLESNFFKRVYNSLLNQKKPYNRLIINLEYKTFHYKIPEYLLFNKYVIFNNTSYKGPCCKLLGSIDILKNDDIVIVMDDDIIMRDNFIDTLYNSFLKNPNAITTNFSRSLVSKKGIIIKEACGYGGFIFKMSNKYQKLKQMYKNMPECARKIDDTWFASCFIVLNVPVIKQTLCCNPWDTICNMIETSTHPNWAELQHNTPRKTLEKKFLSLF